MTKRVFRLAAVLAVLPVFLIAATAADLPAPFTTLTSDYGPRYIPLMPNGLRAGSTFHKGIDYRANNAPVKSVSAGDITAIRWFSGGGWGVEVEESNGHIWQYFHLFKGTAASTNAVTVTGVQGYDRVEIYPQGTGNLQNTPLILFWSGPTDLALAVGPATKHGQNLIVRVGGPPPTVVRGRVVGKIQQNDLIGVSGNSGTRAAHLHMQLNRGDDNPLLYVARPGTGSYTASLARPQGGLVRGPQQWVGIQVNSRGPYDLDSCVIG